MNVTTVSEPYMDFANIHAVNGLLPWFAVRVREKFRDNAEQMLRAQDVEFFSPMTTERRQWSDRQKTVTVPLFPGYLFCRFDPERQLTILRTLGVIDIVRRGARLAEVDPVELKAVERALGIDKHVESLPRLIEGQPVRVILGPLRGVTGVLVEQKNEWKLLLAVTMMNRSVAVAIDRAQVEAISCQ